MKKILCMILTLVLLLGAVSVCLTSCKGGDEDEPPKPLEEYENEAELAEELSRRANDKMDSLLGFRIVSSGSVSFDLLGVDVSTSIRGVEVHGNVGTDQYLHTMQTRMEMSVGDSELLIESDMGYQAGMIYKSEITTEKNKSDGYRIKTAITIDEYIEYMALLGDSISMRFGSDTCTELSAHKGKDGGWVATYSGFKGEMKEELGKEFEKLVSLVGGEFDDAVVTVTVDDDMRFKRVDYDITFLPDSEDAEPISLAVSETYSDYNTAAVPQVSLDWYDEVVGFHHADKVLSVMSDYVLGDGSFVIKTTTDYEMYNGNADTVVNYAEASFSNKDGLSFELKHGTGPDDLTGTYSYSNGMVTENGGPEKPGTELEARAMIETFINPAAFKFEDVQSVTRTENSDGTVSYKIELNDAYGSSYGDSVIDSTGWETSDVTKQELIITLDASGALLSYRAEIRFRIKAPAADPSAWLNYNVTDEVDYTAA